MNTMNAVSAKFTHVHHTHLPLLHHSRPMKMIFSRPASSISFKPRYPPPSRSSSYAPIIRAWSQNPKPQFPLLKTAVVSALTAAALLLSRFYLLPNLAMTAPIVGTNHNSTTSSVYEEEKEDEKEVEQHLASNPEDVEALKKLMEIKIMDKKVSEAINVVDRLIELEPNDLQWPLLKLHLYVNMDEAELAKAGFNEIISKDPLCVEAYHGLVVAVSEEDPSEELKGIEKKIEEGVSLAKKENKKEEVTDFKLLIAQIRMILGKYDEALNVYQELVKEEPRDFRPYLCQGFIYTLLRKEDVAEKYFEKYRRLVPKGHPYASYDNMLATKLFAQKVKNEIAKLKS